MDQSVISAQIRHDGVMLYQLYHGSGRSKSEMEEIRKKAYDGEVVDHAQRRMRSAVDVLVQLTRTRLILRDDGSRFLFRLGFLTLTVPGPVRSAKEVRPVFSRFLSWLRRKNVLYVWKAEYQKRGQVHYHLIINKWLHWKMVKLSWNRLMRKARFLDEYALKTGHFHPNSIDIRSVKSSKGLVNYLMKYLAKPDTAPVKAKGKITKWWSASQTLLGGRYTWLPSASEMQKIMSDGKRIEDDEGRWMLSLMPIKNVLCAGSKVEYAEWKRERRKASWSKKQVKILSGKKVSVEISQEKKLKSPVVFQGNLFKLRRQDGA